jgi:hypothetical protein
MPTKRTLFLHSNPLHDPEPLATTHARVIFCVGDDRFAIDFSSTVTELRLQPAEVIPIEKNRSAKRRRVGLDRHDRTPSVRRHAVNYEWLSSFIRAPE